MTGEAYLTGQATNITGLTLTLVFPPPFPLTLVGKVDLVNVTATFSGLPDIPLTSLRVTLDGGKNGLFSSLCAPSSGTSTATLTDQNGDRTATDPAAFTVSGCPAKPSGGGAKHGGGGGSSAGGRRGLGKPSVGGATTAGLASGRPTLSFTATAGKRAPGLRSLTISLPKGLSVIAKRTHGRRTVAIGLRGARLKAAMFRDDKLVIVVRRPVRTVRVALTGLRESPSLTAEVRADKLNRLKLGIVVRDAKGKQTTTPATIPVKPSSDARAVDGAG